MPRACVVIPTRNESDSVAQVIADVREGLAGTRYDDVVVLVVDDSIDDTRRIARQHDAIVVRGGGEGLGAAMYRGLKAATDFEPDVILAVDGDGQANATREIPRFLEPIEADQADLVLASRFLEPDSIQYRYRRVNRFGVIVLSRTLRAFTGLPLTDSHGGIRAMRPEVAAELEMLGTHTYVQETIIDAAEKGFRIVEIPSIWRERKSGKSRVVGSIPKYVFFTLPILVLRSSAHIRFTYSLGVLCVLAGLLVFAAVLVEEGFSYALGHRTPAFILIALLISAGIQLFGFGVILQLLRPLKKTVNRVEHALRPRVNSGRRHGKEAAE